MSRSNVERATGVVAAILSITEFCDQSRTSSAKLDFRRAPHPETGFPQLRSVPIMTGGFGLASKEMRLPTLHSWSAAIERTLARLRRSHQGGLARVGCGRTVRRHRGDV